MDCIFCEIINKKKPEIIHFEDDDLIAFNDIRPKAPIHILIIPKIHIASIAHLEPGHSDILAKLIYTAKTIAENQGLKGYKLIFNVGREGGQVVDHLHLHLLGGWEYSEDRKQLP